ncbi:MAG: YihY/virulence factor BrkB family protein [Treponema sp.]|nr:YihY/virulence factor BrkB family protein [Treponema sp.]
MSHKHIMREKNYLSKNMLGQFIYLILTFYIQNNLYTCAAACAFSFLFSFIPIVMIVLTILVRIIHADPTLIESILTRAAEYKQMFNMQSFIDTLMRHNVLNLYDFLLVFFILWMARKSFASMMQGLQRIFHYKIKSRPLFNQALIFMSEITLIIISVIIILAIFAIRQLFMHSFFLTHRIYLPVKILGFLPSMAITFSEFALIFIAITLAYYFMSRTKPKLSLCMMCAALCTLSFFIITIFTKKFMNVSNYNVIYGILSGLMILLFQMYMFFTLFLICAQIIYIIQFFDSLVLGELYLLPERDDTKIISIIKRVLFITPSLLMDTDNVSTYKAGDIIFSTGDIPTDSYYVVSGTVTLTVNDNICYCDKGTSFGEEACILERQRIGEAAALTDCKIMKIPASTFRVLLESNQLAAEKALAHLTEYIAKVYGRTH